MKIIRFLLTILSILLLSISIAFAGIPGITEPFDPPNYYSPTSVSIPDSAPSPFALKDLAAQGYKVHDVINSKKDIISSLKIKEQLTVNNKTYPAGTVLTKQIIDDIIAINQTNLLGKIVGM